MPVVKAGGGEDTSGLLLPEEVDDFLSSTARMTAAAPFQAISDGACIYVFRQSIDARHDDAVFKLRSGGSSGQPRRRDYALDAAGSRIPVAGDALLCDRYVLVGGELQLLLDVRFRRSRHKTLPASSKDTLGVQDMDGRMFSEPTLLLGLVRHLDRGRFAVSLLPTQIPDLKRWQIFAFNARTGRIDGFNIERDPDGLFNTQGTQYYTSPDPEYRDAVFERAPGKCPYTGQDLVPILSEADYAETALEFDGVDDCVELGNPPALALRDGVYTLEAWVKHDGPGYLLSKWNEGVSGTFQLRITADDKVALVHDAQPREVVTSISLTPGEFNHIAATYDRRTGKCVLYLNGEPAGSGALGFTASDDRVVIGGYYGAGAPRGSFKGVIDEIRVWSRARTADELASDMRHRLVGNEPGLIAYYRFDEGEGDRLFDQTDSACHGKIRGGAKWVTSDAAVGDHPGVRRDSFALEGRTVASGLSAQLYSMQQSTASGYGEASKPVKRQARLLLAFASGGPGPDGLPTDRQHVATLDFAIARDGRLALVPDQIKLPFIGDSAGNQNLDQTAALAAAVSKLEGQHAALKAEVDLLTAELAGAGFTDMQAQLAAREASVTSLQAALAAERESVGAYWYTFQFVNSNRYISAKDGGTAQGTSLVQVTASDAPATQWRLTPRTGQWYTLTPRHTGAMVVDVNSQVSPWRPILHPLHGGENQQFRLMATDGRVVGDQIPALASELEKLVLILQMNLGGQCFDGNLSFSELFMWEVNHGSPNHQLKVRRVALISGVDVQLAAAIAERDALKAMFAGLSVKQQTLTQRRAELLVLEQELTQARGALAAATGGLAGDEVTFPSRLLYIDRQGLAVTGGLLAFAWSAHAPQLFDSATGDVVLYFRGQTGQFFAAYYSTRCSCAALRLPMGAQRSLPFVARTPGMDLSTATITVADGATPQTCTLTISREGYVETFPDVPRAAGDLARVINGQSDEPAYVGVVADNVFNTDTITLTQGCAQTLPVGSVLRIAGTSVHLVQEAQAGATQLVLSKVLRRAVAGSLVEKLTYDYDSAATNRAGGSLAAGSQLVFCQAAGRVDLAPNGASLVSATAQACSWRSDAPGRAFEFTGDRPGLELAWPPIPVLSAISLDGESEHVELGAAFELGSTDFTIELWIRRDREGRPEFVLAHDDGKGSPAGPPLALGFLADNRFAASQFAVGPASGDLEWHHWAVVFTRASNTWTIYRDGVPEASMATMAYAATGKLVLGRIVRYGTAEFARVSVDRIRVWRRARTAAEILAAFRTPKLPATTGLIAQWTFTDGEPTWDLAGSPAQTAVVQGAPLAVPTFYQLENTPSEDALARLAAPSDLTMEAWIHPGGFDGRRRILYQRSDTSRYTLALEGVQMKQKEVVALDGADDRLASATEFELGATDFTIELWVKRQRSGVAEVVLQHGDGADAAPLRLGFAATDAFSSSSGPLALNTPTLYTDLEWHHWALVYKKLGCKRELYRDGVLVASDALPNAQVSRGALHLGAAVTADKGTTPARALIDEVRVWSRARSAAELLTSHANCLSGFESGLLFYGTVEDGKFRDAGPAGAPVTPTGGAAVQTVDLLALSAGPPPAQRGALQLNTSSDRVEFGNTLTLNDTDFTIELWARRSSSGTDDWYISHGAHDGRTGHTLVCGQNRNGAYVLAFYGNDLVAPTALDFAWHHLAFTYHRASGRRQIFCDGALIGADASAAAYLGAGVLQFGHAPAPWGVRLTGEVRIWKKVRTQQELLDDQRRALTGSEPGLAALLVVEGGQVRDIGPAKLTAKLVGSPVLVPLPVVTTQPLPSVGASLTALEFDGTDDKVDFGTGVVLNATDFTIELWARRIASTRSFSDPLFIHGTHGGQATISAWLTPEGAMALDWGSGEFCRTSASDLSWHHWAIVHTRASRSLRVFRDGVEVVSVTVPGAYAGSGSLVLGTAGQYPARVQMGELRIWDHVRSVDQLAATMTTPLTGQESGLLAYITPSGGQLKDLGPKFLSPTVSGSPNFTPVPVVPVSLPPTSTGYLRAVAHDGVDDVVDAGTGLTLHDTDFTIELWVRRLRIGVWDPLVTHGHADGVEAQTLHISFTEGNNITYAFGGGNLGTPAYPDTEWHHWAFTYNRTTRARKIFRDGIEVAADVAPKAYAGSGKLYLGALLAKNWPPNRYARVQYAELRIWRSLRTQAEIAAGALKILTGGEPGLAFYLSARNGQLRDFGPSRLTLKLTGSPKLIDLVVPLRSDATGVAPPRPRKYHVLAGAGSTFIRSVDAHKPFLWKHLAVSFTQSWAVALDGKSWLEAGNDDSLDLTGEVTLEVFFRPDRTGVLQGLVGKGRMAEGSGKSVPYQLSLTAEGRLRFGFEDSATGSVYHYDSQFVLVPGRFYRVAAVRRTERVMDTKGGKMQSWQDIRLYVDGAEVGGGRFDGAGPTGHDGALEIGRTWFGGVPSPLRGTIGEVRIWKQARDARQICSDIKDGESGLVSRWRFQENAGNVAADAVGVSDAKLRGARWTKNPDPHGSRFRLYVNGLPTRFETLADDLDAPRPAGFALAGLPASFGPATESFLGVLEEVRVWRTVRTEEQVLDNLFTRLKGEKQDVLAYYTFDADSTREDSALLLDAGLRSNHLRLPAAPAERPRIVLSTAPVSNDTAQVRSAIAGVRTTFHENIDTTPGIGEYADMQRDARGDVAGVMKRCYSALQNRQWHLITGYKIGNLLSEWVGQAQFDPQIIGYIEGAPPVPSENLTAGALVAGDSVDPPSLVKFIQADDVVDSLSVSREASISASLTAKMKAELTIGTSIVVAPLGVGTAEKLKVKLGLEAGFQLDVENSWSSESATSQGTTTGRSLAAKTTGLWEDPQRIFNPALGRRWVPHNVGFALVQSETADVFALRLAHNGALVAYRIMPNPDIPKDWNIIPFPINPRYSKQGTLDGAVGFDERGKVLDPDYKNARGYGEYSYYKPREAYALKRRILREQQQLKHRYESYSTQPDVGGGMEHWGRQLLGAMNVPPPPPGNSPESAGFDASSLARRNLVNTYVWTAAGGFFAETTQTTDSVTETTAGKFSLSAGLSATFSFEIEGPIGGGGAQLDVALGASMTLNRSKSREARRAFSLEVETSVPTNLQKYSADVKAQYDADGEPIVAPGKVDAYRWMTFYLDASRDNFDDFAHKVVDPMWIRQSDEPNAAALRAALQSDKKPPCWRIFHRVTFVSRVLPPIPAPGEPPLEQAMRAEAIASNYELIKQLEPYVKEHATSQAALADATRKALKQYLPGLVPHEDPIIQYLSLYYGVAE